MIKNLVRQMMEGKANSVGWRKKEWIEGVVAGRELHIDSGQYTSFMFWILLVGCTGTPTGLRTLFK